MKFTQLNQADNDSVIRFQESLKDQSKGSEFTLFKIDECLYTVIIAFTTSISGGMMVGGDQINIRSFHMIDKYKPGDFPNNIFQHHLSQKTNDGSAGEIIPYPFINPNLEIIRISKRKFILLFSQPGDTGNSLVALQIISNIWQLDQGRIPLHAAGILHKGGLYLFSGPSGAGKSTISLFSQTIGDQVVDEDQLLIYKKIWKKYSAKAWGKNFGNFQAPIRGFFWLIKSASDQLLPISSKQASKRIWEQSLQAQGGILPRGNRKSLFNRINEFSRAIPTFELHFRQAADFWQLIDAQIPYD